MNELNYATKEASKRLVEAGIVLETEFSWYVVNKRAFISKSGEVYEGRVTYPAPSMAEVWRELLDEIEVEDRGSYDLVVSKCGSTTYAGYYTGRNCGETFVEKYNDNPTDALIDLLIWIKKEE